MREQEKCPKCGADRLFQCVRDYTDDGDVIWETQAHHLGGLDCLRRQLAAANQRAKKAAEAGMDRMGFTRVDATANERLEAENVRLTSALERAAKELERLALLDAAALDRVLAVAVEAKKKAERERDDARADAAICLQLCREVHNEPAGLTGQAQAFLDRLTRAEAVVGTVRELTSLASPLPGNLAPHTVCVHPDFQKVFARACREAAEAAAKGTER